MGKINKEMEKNLKNERKFYAQYWGQKVGCTSYQKSFLITKSNFLNIEYLLLKPLSAISDEDAIEVVLLNWEIFRLASNMEYKVTRNLNEPMKVYVFKEFKVIAFQEITEWNGKITSIDYLRSKSYALPYNGLSVESQIAYGWVRLSE